MAAATDFNNDGKADLVFQHTDGTLALWLMDGAKLASGQFMNPKNPGGTWKVLAPR